MKEKLKEGQEVAHKENLKVKMTIGTIHNEFIEVSTGKIKEDGKGFETKPKKIIRGVTCHWFGPEDPQGRKELLEHKFHTKELVPWEVAEKGIDEVIKYLLN